MTIKKRQTLLYYSTVRNLAYIIAEFNVADFHSRTFFHSKTSPLSLTGM
jgi:hypothetical protein